MTDETTPIMPFGDFRPDVSDYEQAYTDDVSNVLARSDGYAPFPGFSALANSLTGAFSSAFSTAFDSAFSSSQHQDRGFFRAINTDGSTTVFAATSTRLYKLNTTNYTWTDVSKSGAAYPAVSSNEQWQAIQFVNFVIFVQANAPPQYWDLTSSTAFADLAGSPPQARYIAVVGQFVVLTGLLNNPYRMQWCALGNPAAWTAGVNSSSFQDLPDGGITRGVAGGEIGNVFQDTTIRRMIYAPGNPIIFQIERITQDLGLFAPYSLVSSGDMIFFNAAQGFMKMAPNGYPERIGKERVDRTFKADIDTTAIQLFLAASDPQNSRVFWAYKSTSSTNSNAFDKMLCFDYGLDKWTPGILSGEYIGSISQPGLTLENLDTISTSLDALSASLDSFAVATTPQIAMFDTTHALGFLKGGALEATISTSRKAKPGRRMYIDGFRPLTDAPTVYGSVGTGERLADIETFSTENIMDDTGTCPANVSGRYARGRIRIPAGTVWSYAIGIEPTTVLDGER